MRWITTSLLLAALVSSSAWAEPQDGRYLYLSMPDAAQKQGRSGVGILIFDIDDGHKFVRRIELPIFAEGLRGFAGHLGNQAIYYSSTNKLVGAFDIINEKVIWEQRYPQGADRSSVSEDGSKIYVPTGWWYKGEDAGFLVVDARTGKLLKSVAVGPQAHNSIVRGDRLYLGTTTTLSIFDTKDERLIRQITDVGERGIFPFTIDGKGEIGYICLGAHVGFDVVNLKTGEKLHRVFAGEEKIPHRTHGVGLTPDETELWISDQRGQKLFIYDATQTPPAPKGSVELSQGGHGWVAFSLDGKYAWCHTPDVFDVKTKKRIAVLRDEKGAPVSGSKFLELHFKDGKITNIGHEFGLGRKPH